MSDVLAVTVDAGELVGLGRDLESHAATDPDEVNLRAVMLWVSERLQKLAEVGIESD